MSFVKLDSEKIKISSFTPYLSSKCLFASKIVKILKFLLSHHICPLTAQIMTVFGNFLKNISQSKNTVRFFLYVGVYPVLYIRSFQFQQMLMLVTKFCLFQHIL